MKKWMIYTLYTAAVTLVFLYYLFPTEAVTAYINHRISKSMPGLQVSADRIRPSFPPGLKFNTLVLLDADRPIISADRLKITPAYSTILSTEKSFHLTGDSCGGHLKGTAQISGIVKNTGLSLDLAFEELKIDRIQGLHEWVPPKLSGMAEGSFRFSSTPPPFGKGSAEITVSGCGLDFNPSLWGITQLRFNSIESAIELNGRRVFLKRLDVKSEQVSGKASGFLNLEVPVKKSRLNLSGYVMPQPGFIRSLGDLFPIDLFMDKSNRNRGVPFQISGTIEQPDFRLK
jgi:type II secretion system protein N